MKTSKVDFCSVLFPPITNFTSFPALQFAKKAVNADGDHPFFLIRSNGVRLLKMVYSSLAISSFSWFTMAAVISSASSSPWPLVFSYSQQILQFWSLISMIRTV